MEHDNLPPYIQAAMEDGMVLEHLESAMQHHMLMYRLAYHDAMMMTMCRYALEHGSLPVSVSHIEEGRDAEPDKEATSGASVSRSALRRQRRQRRAGFQETGKMQLTALGFGTRSDSSIDKLLEKLDGGEPEKSQVYERIRGSVLLLSMDASGCRVVQKALEVADTQTAGELVAELHGQVLKLIESPHGNYVLQKVVEALPTAMSELVAAELRGAGTYVACHQYGCRVLCRLVKRSGAEHYTMALVEEVLTLAEEHCRHKYAHHVLESILDYGRKEHKHRIATAVHSNLLSNARDRHGSYVIEKLLQTGLVEDQSLLVSALVDSQDDLLSLAKDQFGFHVVKALIAHSAYTESLVRPLLEQAEESLVEDTNGARVLEALKPQPLPSE